MIGIAFWGLKTGQKQGGRFLNARTAKTNRKTTHTLKHNVKVKKISNRLDARNNSKWRPKALKSSFNPRLPEPFFGTRLPKGGGYHPQIFAIKPPILMILVLEDRYESPLSIDTKNVPVALHLTSQWRQSHEKLDFTDFGWK